MTLDEVRKEIDVVDEAMKQLFIRRMECAKHVAEAKAVTGGDVFVPEREKEIIARRTEGIVPESDNYNEYEAFLRHLICISRSRQYGVLKEMQNAVVAEALSNKGISPDSVHTRIGISFCCDYTTGNLNQFMDMAALNRIRILEMRLVVESGKQKIDMTLEGNVNDAGMKKLLCQIGKESEDFRIQGLW